jgi:1,4-dihydroxy-2-naphthoate octaprenyltransferase
MTNEAAVLKAYWLAIRPWSFIMTIISWAAGTAVAAARGPLDWGLLAVTGAALICFHGGANVINDYFDTVNQVDRPDTATVNYRPHGLLTPPKLLLEALAILGLAVALGLVLAWRSPHAWWIGLLGLAAAFFYTGKPLAYKYRGWAEPAVFLVWGPLMVEVSYVAQRQSLSGEALLVSLPLGTWVAMVLLANNLRDIETDRSSRITTLAIKLGLRRGYRLWAAAMAATYLYSLGLILAGWSSPWLALVFVSAPLTLNLAGRFGQNLPEDADAQTARVYLFFGLLFTAGLFMGLP